MIDFDPLKRHEDVRGGGALVELLTIIGGGIRKVAPCGIPTIIPVGTASDYNLLGVTSLTISAVTALSTDAIIVFLGINTPSSEDVQPELSYNGAIFQPEGAGPGFGDASYGGEIYILTDFTGTTADITIQLAIVDSPKAASATAYVMRGLKDLFVNVVDPPTYKVTEGSSTTPSVSMSTPTAQTCEVLAAMVVTKGPSTDAAGAWGNSFTGLQRVGTTAGATPALNITVSDAYRVVTALGSYTADKSGITSRAWLATIVGSRQ